MGRPKNTEARRAQIIDGLLEVMAERGYESASVARIGKAAGLTPGLVHYHFENKQAVLVALVERLAAGFRDRFETRARAKTSPLDKIDAFIDAHVALGQDSDPRAVRAWVLVGAEAVRQDEVRAVYADSVEARLETLTELLRLALKEKGQATRPARALAASLLSSIEGAYLLSAASPEALPRGFAAPTLRKTVRTWLAGDAG